MTLEIKTTRELYEGYIREHKTWADYNKKWVSVESEFSELNNILEIIASADNIPNGNHYMELSKAIQKHIKKLKVMRNEKEKI